MDEDHVMTVDNSEAMGTIRDSLPEGDCRTIFDILSQQGDAYAHFSAKYGYGEPKINNIAQFLGITTRAVNQHRTNIKLLCYANSMVPANH